MCSILNVHVVIAACYSNTRVGFNYPRQISCVPFTHLADKDHYDLPHLDLCTCHCRECGTSWDNSINSNRRSEQHLFSTNWILVGHTVNILHAEIPSQSQRLPCRSQQHITTFHTEQEERGVTFRESFGASLKCHQTRRQHSRLTWGQIQQGCRSSFLYCIPFAIFASKQ